MGLEAVITILMVVAVLATLACTRISPDAVLLGAVAGLTLVPIPSESGWTFGVLSAGDALSGFGNTGLLTVAVLFVVVTGLRETGAIDLVGSGLLGTPKTGRGAIGWLFVRVCGLSAFLNNTPVVAILIPAVSDLARRISTSPSKLLIPLSYAAILGGTCSLIGTSTNLLVAGFVSEQTDLPPLSIFSITWVGLPCALIGGLYLILIGPRLLPDRRGSAAALADPREFTAEMVVPAGSPLHGLSIEEAALRQLPEVFVAEIERSGELIRVTPETRLLAGDRLVFVGAVAAIRDLQQLRGLSEIDAQSQKINSPRHRRQMFEAVVPTNAPITGKTIRESRFRHLFDAAVLAVARQGQRVPGRLGDIKLRPGDTLLLESDREFDQRHRREFLLVRPVEDSIVRRHDRAWLSIGITLLMVVAAATGTISMLQAALAAAIAMVLTRCCSVTTARDGVNWSLLIAIGAAIGLGKALDASGAATSIGDAMVRLAGSNPFVALAAIYLLTTVLTEIVTNNAAAAVAFPLAQATASALGVDLMPFVITIMMAASASFSSPLGYQTNLMVMGPGGYRFGDFLRIGLPLNLLVGFGTVILAPMVFPFWTAN
ncbi:MAG: SLC13 family permease [Phycisphaerales bacterium]